MAALIKAAIRAFRWFDEYGDPRVEKFFLMGSPWPVLAIVGFYLYFVNNLGPQLMRDRKPFKLDRILMAYNVLQILLCLYLTERSLALAWGPGTNFRWICEPVDYTINPHSESIIGCVWLYVMIKLVDLLDTVFFVLRKKASQVTFLHVYHHAGMVLGSWFTCKFLAGGHGTFLGCINSFVHVVMYTYYLITSVWEKYKQNVWWKKYITQLQMVQFLLIAVHSLAVLFVRDCQFPRMYCMLLFMQNFFMLILFYDFYRKAYLKKKTS